ncbi:MAG: hypothetical protein CHKLHMKO_00307 [Candidatus Argoarchaeum ethanivorans]|uniref:Uncharacterized protein n=1 Tax=Candidatus Argoarchaeum ethanivorans TaxID=2608793 RepID=A0A811TA45_9EURY|nr:MAG: hypothetical protein CHKLHMKO_00307 [Candidatus Argoarchaeum ethanivorans]
MYFDHCISKNGYGDINKSRSFNTLPAGNCITDQWHYCLCNLLLYFCTTKLCSAVSQINGTTVSATYYYISARRSCAVLYHRSMALLSLQLTRACSKYRPMLQSIRLFFTANCYPARSRRACIICSSPRFLLVNHIC